MKFKDYLKEIKIKDIATKEKELFGGNEIVKAARKIKKEIKKDKSDDLVVFGITTKGGLRVARIKKDDKIEPGFQIVESSLIEEFINEAFKPNPLTKMNTVNTFYAQSFTNGDMIFAFTWATNKNGGFLAVTYETDRKVAKTANIAPAFFDLWSPIKPSEIKKLDNKALSKMEKVIEKLQKKDQSPVSGFDFAPGILSDSVINEDLKLSKKDNAVIDAFIDGKSATSKKLDTDGKTLDGLWMGGSGIAGKDSSGKIVMGPIGGRSGQTVQKKLRKLAPKNDIKESANSFKDFVTEGKETRVLKIALLDNNQITLDFFEPPNFKFPDKSADKMIKWKDVPDIVKKQAIGKITTSNKFAKNNSMKVKDFTSSFKSRNIKEMPKQIKRISFIDDSFKKTVHLYFFEVDFSITEGKGSKKYIKEVAEPKGIKDMLLMFKNPEALYVFNVGGKTLSISTVKGRIKDVSDNQNNLRMIGNSNPITWRDVPDFVAKEVVKYIKNGLTEDAPTNSASSGDIDFTPTKRKKRNKFAEHTIFEVDCETFSKVKREKITFERMAKHFNIQDGVGAEIHKFNRTHPYEGIVLQDEQSKAMMFFKRKRNKPVKESINEAKLNSSDFLSKGIYNMQGRKVQGTRSANLSLNALMKDGETLQPLTWKEYKSLNVPESASEFSKEQFVNSLFSKEKNFGKKVDFNALNRRNASFEEKIDWILKNTSIKLTKKGIPSI